MLVISMSVRWSPGHSEPQLWVTESEKILPEGSPQRCWSQYQLTSQPQLASVNFSIKGKTSPQWLWSHTHHG